MLSSRLIHGNYHAPMEEALERGIKALGPGIWTWIWPKITPYHNLLALIRLRRSCSLPNCSSIQANTLKGLPFPDNTFDYVFQRYACCVTGWIWCIFSWYSSYLTTHWVDYPVLDVYAIDYSYSCLQKDWAVVTKSSSALLNLEVRLMLEFDFNL